MLGFEKRKPEILTVPLSADVMGWVGLNKAIGHGENLEINVVMGVRHQGIESLLSDLLQEPFNTFSPPTLAGNIGYLSPGNRYVPFLFSSSRDVALIADELCNEVKTYGLDFARKVTDLSALVEAMQVARFGMSEQIGYRVPVGYLLLGESDKAIWFINQKIDEIGSRTDPAALRYKNFAERITEHIVKTN